MPIGWLTRSPADVPAGDTWLGERERVVLAGLQRPKRRADWRLGRWTAKAALAAMLGEDPARIEVLAAADGAPEAWLDGAPAPVSISLSHRADRALAAVAAAPCVVGCDLELLEPRSPAFVRDWLAPEEHGIEPNLAWTAKEAAAKVRREGLRLDVRSAVTRLSAGPPDDGWQPLTVEWTREGIETRGWWRVEDGYVMTLAATPVPAPPRRLDHSSRSSNSR
jgi:4'-phosphopantetheinyl transferase